MSVELEKHGFIEIYLEKWNVADWEVCDKVQ